MTLDGAALSYGLLGAETDPRAYLLALYPDLAARIPPLASVVGTAEPMVATVNHDIWIAPCGCGARGLPAPGCVVFVGYPLGWCPRCLNAAYGRGWRRVSLPDEMTMAAIAAIVACRPNVEDRNWEPNETLDDLRAQNVEHGDPVPAELSSGAALAARNGHDWRSLVRPFSPWPPRPHGR